MLRIRRCMAAKGGQRNKSAAAWIIKQILVQYISQVADVVLSIKSRAVMKSRPWILLERLEPDFFLVSKTALQHQKSTCCEREEMHLNALDTWCQRITGSKLQAQTRPSLYDINKTN